MATTFPEFALTADLRALLAGLRWRIRLYIWLEGISLAVVWLVAMFWIGFGLDYLPVILGAGEMPQVARGIFLGATGAGLAYVFYRWILRRTFVRLADRPTDLSGLVVQMLFVPLQQPCLSRPPVVCREVGAFEEVVSAGIGS